MFSFTGCASSCEVSGSIAIAVMMCAHTCRLLSWMSQVATWNPVLWGNVGESSWHPQHWHAPNLTDEGATSVATTAGLDDNANGWSCVDSSSGYGASVTVRFLEVKSLHRQRGNTSDTPLLSHTTVEMCTHGTQVCARATWTLHTHTRKHAIVPITRGVSCIYPLAFINALWHRPQRADIFMFCTHHECRAISQVHADPRADDPAARQHIDVWLPHTLHGRARVASMHRLCDGLACIRRSHHQVGTCKLC